MYPLHENDTGSFQELAHASDVDFGQLSILVIEPGCQRGGHYHTRKKEWFCCIHGKCILEITNVRDYSMRNVVLLESKREFVTIKPYESHLVRNTSEAEKCELLIIVNEEYDEKNPDTIKFDRVEYE